MPRVITATWRRLAKSLSFILEIGWKIYDYRKSQVLRQKKQEIRTEVEGIAYSDPGQGPLRCSILPILKICVGAFNRKERFIDLSPDTVGLLETDAMQKGEGLGAARDSFGCNRCQDDSGSASWQIF